MAVLPQVHLFFPCAGVRVDEGNNRITIFDPLSSVYFAAGQPFPCSSGILFFFVDFQCGLGNFNCRIRCQDEKQRLVAETKPTSVEFTLENRFDGVQFVFELAEFELQEPGLYEFGLFANYAETPIAKAVVRFLKRA